ncbi:MAG: hypothetical protein IJX63_03980 [Lachnospiraceae bacterium]|nr:hypothetical protein [Lachnospiraceae bacterium]
MFQKKLKCMLCSTVVAASCLMTGCGDTDITTGGGSGTSESTAGSASSDTSPTPQAPASTAAPDTASDKLTARYTVSTDTSVLDESYHISDTLYGIFLEDINHALDGGMYAELVKNRSFEYGKAAAKANLHGWATTDSTGEKLKFEAIDGTEDGSFLHEQNPHYCRITNTGSEYLGISNKGYLEGMYINPGAAYDFSIYMRSDSYKEPVRISLVSEEGIVYAQNTISLTGEGWNKYELVLLTERPDSTECVKVQLAVEILEGTVDVDMVSLFPQDTYKGTVVRSDIGKMLEELNPTFLRFPGGCVIEGRDEESIYSWKDSIGNGASLTVGGVTTVGDVAVRPQGRSIWQGTQAHPYYTTYGIGFYEFFELCEVLDCIPLPVLNAGMTCPIQSQRYQVYDIGSEEFKQCVQDALDLVEFCLGDADTYWGSVRIAMGHEEPFALKYVGIGNEQWQSEYFQHYREFVNAFNAAAEERPELYGDIELIVANGPASGDRVGWNYMTDCNDFDDYRTTLVDEHYYESPAFFFTNTHRYDSYDRSCQAKVFLGEYAAQSNTLEAALAEAAYMTGLEKNGDVVEMACYAPLFANKVQNQWTPDLIWYSNEYLNDAYGVYGSVNYYVQQLFANNKGTTNLPATLEISAYESDNVLSGKIGLGSWQTSVAYDNLTVTDNETGEVLYSCTFDEKQVLKDDGYEEHEGDWDIKDGRLIQYNTGAPADGITGDVVYVGDTGWKNYTMTVDAEILEGAEGFLIPVCVQDTDNNIFWNIGGWGNTVSCLQIVKGGAKSGQISGTVKNMQLQHGKTYTIKMVVEGDHITGYLNDMKYLDYTHVTADALYETASVDTNGDLLLKVINTTGTTAYVSTVLESFDPAAYESTAEVTILSGDSLSAVNSYENPRRMYPYVETCEIGQEFTYEAPMYSLNIIRIKKK